MLNHGSALKSCYARIPWDEPEATRFTGIVIAVSENFLFCVMLSSLHLKLDRRIRSKRSLKKFSSEFICFKNQPVTDTCYSCQIDINIYYLTFNKAI